MISRTVFEWRTLDYGEDISNRSTIPAKYADRIARVASGSVFSGRGGDGVLEHGRKAIKARGVVGIVVAEDCSLEILPKIDFDDDATDEVREKGRVRRRLVHMLAKALDIRLDVGKVTELDWQNSTLLEVLIKLFAQKLIEAVRQGMPRSYIPHEEDLKALRGRVDHVRQFTILAVNPSKLACCFDELAPDIALNQIMKAAVNKLLGLSRSSANQQILRELAFVYADVSNVPIERLPWQRVRFDRTNARWRELYDLARLLLYDRYQNTTVGGENGFALLFEMNVLFEQYVARTLARLLIGTDLKVIQQGGLRYCLNSEAGGLFQTKPDILIKSGDQTVQIIDTKWKRISSRIDDRKQGISQADVYQMFVYARLYQCPRLTLLFPHHNKLGGRDGLQATHQITDHQHWLETATVDVSYDNIDTVLRRLVAGKPASVKQKP